MPRKKAEPKPKPPKIDRRDWQNCPTAEWNTLTVLAYFADMNREKFGAEYVPMRNFGFEQRQIKTALDKYGAEVMRTVFEEAFAEYRPTGQYPHLTAGFVISYVASRILPRILAARETEREAQQRREQAEDNAPTFEQVSAWL